MKELLAQTEQLLQDFVEAQEQLIEELKVNGEVDYAKSMTDKLRRKVAHYRSVIEKETGNLD